MKSHVLILLFILVCCGYAGAASQGDSIQVCTGVYPSLSLSVDTAGFVFSGHLEGILPSEPYKGTEKYQEIRPVSGSVHRLAFKTNLLYDVLLMPSLEVEYRINDRWSVNLEGEMAWWKKEDRHKYYQLATISPEGRYWFKTRKPWHGHYIGIFSGFSWYDLENGKDGYKGEAVMAGLSYGYMFPVSRTLSFEAGIGVGYMHTRYEEYSPVDGHYVYQQTESLNYFGPLKLKFALVWRLWDTGKKKGGAR